MSKETRIVHTGLYSNRAEGLIREIVNDLQNSYSGAKKTKKMASLLNSLIQRGIDNEVLITSTSPYCWSKKLWNGLSDNQVLRHVIWMYKCLIIKRTEKKSWKRNCTAFLDPYTDSKISEVYFLYDMFHQRKNFKRNYPQNYSDDLIGIPLDPITVELKNAQLEEIKKIETDLQQRRQALSSQKYTEREDAYRAIEAKYKKLLAEVETEAAEKIQKLKDEMAAIASLNILANVG